MENEYIRREVAEQVICEACERPGCPILWGDDCDRIDRLNTIPPADVRPVVYCKDCKHSDTFGSDCTEATFPLKCLSVRYGGVFPHWFCEHGERNGGADDA